ncbi:MAG TPA: hypothetical protein VHC20_01615 [Candidatus Paceibacterota bacterium]|nr:hypothetical protein [Candidatus Paceibacterota bacterium]
MALSNPPLRVLVAGPPSSGKTTLLTGQFLDLDRVSHSGLPAEFAGSYTLHEYERMCDTAFRWQDGARAAVPRTPRGLERESAWLHLAFRFPTDGVVRHLLFSDMPGEAFVQWCNDKSAMPIETLAAVDVFWVVVDASRAAIKAERTAATDLLKRIRAEAAERPVQVILTKVDKLVDINSELKHKDVVHAAGQLVADLRRAWGSDAMAISPVAALPKEQATNSGWQTLEPIARLLAPRPPAAVPRRTNLIHYVDYMGLG